MGLKASPHQITNPFKTKAPRHMTRRFAINSLTMSYFHTGIRTIIGAEAFHYPVRDGKEWGHLAMVIRLKLLPRSPGLRGQFVESYQHSRLRANLGNGITL